MLTTLIESKRTTRRSPGGAVTSVTVHAALIILAVAVTAHATVPPPPRPADPHLIYLPAPAPVPPVRTARDRHASPSESDPLPAPPEHSIELPPTEIPTHVPPIGVLRPPITIDEFPGPTPSQDDAGIDTHTGPGGPGDTYTWRQVEKQTQPVPGNPSPVYPSMLESAMVAGEVVAQFVVDTAGRADMSTFKVLEATNELFVDAVKRVLPTWHFYPAETGGHKVKQLVQMRFTFTMR